MIFESQRIVERFVREFVSFVGEISWIFEIFESFRISFGVSKILGRFLRFFKLSIFIRSLKNL